MKVTINDIARAAGVAKSTVSKVLNDAPTISEATKEKVRQVIKDLQYTPSSIATQLARSASFNIAFIINMDRKSDFSNPFFFSLLSGAESVTCAHGYELTIANASYGDTELLNRYVYSKKADGLLIHSSIISPELAEELRKTELPYVVIGRPAVPKGTLWVDIDNDAGSEIAVSHLLEQGYRRIGMLTGMPGDPISQNRLNGFKRAMASRGVTDDALKLVRTGPGDEASGERLMTDLLQQNERPDAIVCTNNYLAFGALQALEKAGLSVPGSFGVVAFDNFPIAPYMRPPLTVIHMDTHELGIMASTMLLERIREPSVSVEPQILLPELFVRSSTRKGCGKDNGTILGS
ncbi:LacI family DNA-binding transcriptional regulator [Paenibacillus chartarius]|uniref:LacI family DNA-binding transcriptional regulator n=1 Tax=Paenibacillus chartarius TaxID=747481 RepID=A0ABV6DTR0_9BACL